VTGRQKVALAVALAVPLAGFGLRPAMAGPSALCGTVTKTPTCEQAGVRLHDLYQVSNTLNTGTPGTTTWLCDGGPAPEDRDTALADNLLQLLVAEPGALGQGTVLQVTDSTGRLVGYTSTVTTPDPSGGLSLRLYVTCFDDH